PVSATSFAVNCELKSVASERGLDAQDRRPDKTGLENGFIVADRQEAPIHIGHTAKISISMDRVRSPNYSIGRTAEETTVANGQEEIVRKGDVLNVIVERGRLHGPLSGVRRSKNRSGASGRDESDIAVGDPLQEQGCSVRAFGPLVTGA